MRSTQVFTDCLDENVNNVFNKLESMTTNEKALIKSTKPIIWTITWVREKG